jgi:hypothetical protein
MSVGGEKISGTNIQLADDAAAAYAYAAPAIRDVLPQADIFMSMVRNVPHRIPRCSLQPRGSAASTSYPLGRVAIRSMAHMVDPRLDLVLFVFPWSRPVQAIFFLQNLRTDGPAYPAERADPQRPFGQRRKISCQDACGARFPGRKAA